jgi:hypothetical protein
MQKLIIIIFLFTFSIAYSQSLPIDFEGSVTTADFIDFDGGTASVIANPQSNGINTSATVAQIIRSGGEIWAGSKIELSANLDFTTNNLISMKVFTSAPAGTTVKMKLEGAGVAERDVQTSVSNEWEVLTWDFTATPANSNTIVFMFDFGNVGDGSANSTFLFDDIEQLFGGTQIDLPVDFEGSMINYTTTDFGGNASALVADPMDASNHVIQAVKTDQAATWAGTTIGTPAGFATDIPLTLTESKMTVKVWSPEAGTPIRLKVEDSSDPTHTCETETNTTVSGDWEVMEFDFANQAPGTESLAVGLSMGWTYNMASIFFNFGTDGATAGEKTYYFDNVQFGSLAVGVNDIEIENIKVFPNPTNDQWKLVCENDLIINVEVYDLKGTRILTLVSNNQSVTIDASLQTSGIYMAKIYTPQGSKMIKLIKE